jgi:hypothetical protein
MGFYPDPPGFKDLPSELQHERLERWNKIRKVRKPSRRGGRAEPEPPTRDVVLDQVVEAAAAAAASAPSSAAATEQGKSVLGRIPLVRREGATGLDPLGRLLSFF